MVVLGTAAFEAFMFDIDVSMESAWDWMSFFACVMFFVYLEFACLVKTLTRWSFSMARLDSLVCFLTFVDSWVIKEMSSWRSCGGKRFLSFIFLDNMFYEFSLELVFD